MWFNVQFQTEWLCRHIGRTVLMLLDAPWILDVNVTIRPMYGKQQGAVVGYNPHTSAKLSVEMRP
jgi:hypothetical protein